MELPNFFRFTPLPFSHACLFAAGFDGYKESAIFRRKRLICGIPLQSGYFKIPYKQAELHPTDLLADGTGATYKCFRRAKNLAEGRLRRPEHSNAKEWSRLADGKTKRYADIYLPCRLMACTASPIASGKVSRLHSSQNLTVVLLVFVSVHQ